MKVGLSAQFKQRIIIGIIVTGAVLLAIYFAMESHFKPFFALGLATLIGIGLWEFYRFTEAVGLRPQKSIGIIGSTLFVTIVFLVTQQPSLQVLVEAALLLLLFLAFIAYFVIDDKPIKNIAATIMGWAYVTLPLSCILPILYSSGGREDGRLWLLYLLFVTKMTDTGAYFVGNLCGNTPLAPYISPKKTWEGALGGFVTAIATGICFSSLGVYFFDKETFGLTLSQGLWLSAALSIAAQFGDLVESLLKRDANVKDSNQLPGLGGVLDMLDSLVFATPLLYITLK